MTKKAEGQLQFWLGAAALLTIQLGIYVAWQSARDGLFNQWLGPTPTTLKLLTAGLGASACLATAGFLLANRHRLATDRHALKTVVTMAAVIWLFVLLQPVAGVRDNYYNVLLARGWVNQGFKPYLSRPANFPQDPLFPFVEPQWRDESLMYGPLWALAAAAPVAAARAPASQLFGLRLLVVLAYFAAGCLLWRIWGQRASADPQKSSVAHDLFLAAWLLNPAAVFEIANCGHNEGLLILGLAVFAIGLIKRRPELALPGLTAAVLIKYWPVLLLPALAGLRGARRRRWLTGVIVSAVLTAAVLIAVGAPLSATLHPLLRHATLVAPQYFSPLFALLLGSLKLLGLSPATAFAGAQAFALVLLIASAVIAGWLARRGRLSPLAAAGLIIAIFLAAALAWLQPWYLLAALPFAYDARRHWLAPAVAAALGVAGFLSYALPWTAVVALMAILAIATVCLRLRIRAGD